MPCPVLATLRPDSTPLRISPGCFLPLGDPNGPGHFQKQHETKWSVTFIQLPAPPMPFGINTKCWGEGRLQAEKEEKCTRPLSHVTPHPSCSSCPPTERCALAGQETGHILERAQWRGTLNDGVYIWGGPRLSHHLAGASRAQYMVAACPASQQTQICWGS